MSTIRSYWIPMKMKQYMLTLNGKHRRLIFNKSEYFRKLHDTRIIPDVIFGCTTVIFSITTLRMGYIGYQYATQHASDFDNHCDRIINVLEKNNESMTTVIIELNESNPIEIVCNDQHKNNEFTKDVINLLETKFQDNTKYNIKPGIIKTI
eukprot:327381_1